MLTARQYARKSRLLLVSFWAGTAKYLTSLNGQKPTIFGWLSETCVSGFVGIIAAMTCQY
ncbi:phage holin family protein, partial [Marinobacter sp.]|uniref:phage holin family protein n=1 Tax=Marinobacter sp. TaxID=50741 RepID=UPI0035C7263A